MNGLFVDDMIHAATKNELRDRFIRDYKADFDITLEDAMSLFSLDGDKTEQEGPCHPPGHIRAGDSRRVQDVGVEVLQAQEDADAAGCSAKADCLKTPDLVKQKVHRSFVPKLQFAASWVSLRCYITFSDTQLDRFCASAGLSNWAALHHVMGYLEENPSLKLTYWKG